MKERKGSIDDLEQFIDLRRPESDPEMFAIALALRHIRTLISHGGSDIGRPSDDSALHPHHLEAFLARAIEMKWKDKRVVQAWHRLHLFLSHLKEAGERGKCCFRKI